MIRRWMVAAAAAVATTLAGPAFAVADEAGPQVDYTNHKAVRAFLRTAGDLERIHELGARLLSCAEGVGPVDYILAPDEMPALEASGIPFVVLHDDLQALIDAERARIEAHRRNVADGGAWLFDEYKDLAEIQAYLDELVQVDADLAAANNRDPIIQGGVRLVGNSIEGRQLKAVHLTGAEPGAPTVLFNGCQHAREWVSPMTVMYILDRMVRTYDTDPEVKALLDRVEVIIIPHVNPDGYVYSWGPDRFWRKNRRNNGGGSWGVDNNRNWGTGWGGQGSSGNPDSETYRGTAPFSEPETAAMRDYFLAHPVDATIDFHSYSQLVLSPWAYQPGTPNDNGFHNLVGELMSDAIRTVHGKEYIWGPVYDTLYPAAGGSVDWTWDGGGALSWTIELRDTGQFGFDLPPDQILPTGQENFEAVLALMEFVASGVSYSFPGGLPAIIEADTPTVVDVVIVPLSSGDLDPSTAKLYSRIGNNGSFTAGAMTHQGGDDYQATLPATPCGLELQYYFEIQPVGGGATYRSPLDAPDSVYAAEAFNIEVTFEDMFETNTGWSVENLGATSGDWQRGVPVNDPNWQYDPFADSDGSGQCYLTQNELGNTDVDNGAVRLTSPVFEMADGGTVSYDYYLYLTREDGTDRLVVDFSNDGGATWHEVASHETNGGTEWRSHVITTDDLNAANVPPTATMQARFTANDADPQSIVEAGVDHFLVSSVGCDSNFALPTSFNVVFGAYQSGTVEDLHESDDAYLRIEQRPAFTPLLPLIRLETEGTANNEAPSSLVVTLETGTNAMPSQPMQKLLLYSYDANAWEQVDQRLATLTDQSIEITIDTDPGRFIEAGTRTMRMRIDWFDPGNVFSPAWGTRTDQAIWEVVP